MVNEYRVPRLPLWRTEVCPWEHQEHRRGWLPEALFRKRKWGGLPSDDGLCETRLNSLAWFGDRARRPSRPRVQDGGYGASRGTNAEKGAFQFQLGLGQKIGFNSTETNYLKNLIAHPESLSGYYNSPVK